MSIIFLIEVPNNFDMSDPNDDVTKGANSEVLITDTAASVKMMSHAKRNADGILSLKKAEVIFQQHIIRISAIVIHEEGASIVRKAL